MTQTLADDLLTLLPLHPNGLPIKTGAELLASDYLSVRSAFLRLDEESKAKLLRRGRGGGFYLVPLDYPGRICAICKREFKPCARETRRAKTCSRECAAHLRWQNEDMRARHRASVKVSRSSPAVLRANAERRLRERTPEARALRSEQSRKAWADPESRARRLNSIDKAWENPERREHQRKKTLKLWNDPGWRAKTCDAMRTGKRGRFKRAILALAVEHPHMTMPAIAAATGRTLEQVRVVMQRARCKGEIGPRPGDGPRLRKKFQNNPAGFPPRRVGAGTRQTCPPSAVPAHPSSNPMENRNG